jgi:dCMP deaminase
MKAKTYPNRKKKWDFRFLELAKFIALWSKDPSTQTGAVIVDDRSIVSVGYNGFPRGVKDTSERLNDRKLKYKLIIHCEQNAIIHSNRSLNGCTLYTWPFMSCSKCAQMVIQSGISRCVAPKNNNPRWVEDFKLSKMMLEEAGIKLILLDIPEEKHE